MCSGVSVEPEQVALLIPPQPPAEPHAYHDDARWQQDVEQEQEQQEGKQSHGGPWSCLCCFSK